MKKSKKVICADCNKVFITKATNALRCPECRIKHKKSLYALSKKRRYSKQPYKTINEVVRELEAYNKEHNTHLNYGQYVSMMEGRN